MATKDTNTGFFATIKPFLFGGLSGMTATSVIQPIDTVKVRIQSLGETGGKDVNPFHVTKEILEKEGFTSFYRGLDSALFRQATYGTARLGIYKSIFNWRKETKGDVVFLEKCAISLTAGFLGSLIGNPADLALVRFQTDSMLPAEQRRNYKNVFDAFGRIIKEEGLINLWKGSSPTVVRAMTINLGMLTTFDELKERINSIRGTKDELSTRIMASIGSGIVCATISLPADNIKTKLQKMSKLPDGTYPYSGLLDCFAQSVKRQGITGLWVGLPTYIFRIAPHAIITLLMQSFLHTTFGNEK